jgi:hypothetical protein
MFTLLQLEKRCLMPSLPLPEAATQKQNENKICGSLIHVGKAVLFYRNFGGVKVCFHASKIFIKIVYKISDSNLQLIGNSGKTHPC